MLTTRRSAVLYGLATTVCPQLPHSLVAQELRLVRMGLGFRAMNTAGISLYTGEALGLAREQGIRIESAILGSAANNITAINKGAVEFASVPPSFFLPLYAKGELPPIVSFFEYTYPYKWDVAVLPNSAIKTYSDLRGKKIGVSNVGSTDYPVTRVVLKGVGIDPDKDVTWTAVGDGVTAGVALQRGAIDALAYFDTGFGVIENAEIPMRYLPRPAKVPMIGGNFIGARRDFLEQNRALCVAYGKVVAMTTVYTLANPEAAARAFISLFPSTVRRDVSQDKAVQLTLQGMSRRLPLLRPPYPGAKLGQIFQAEFEEEAALNEVKISDYSSLYTNDLIDEINDFDHGKVVAAARART